MIGALEKGIVRAETGEEPPSAEVDDDGAYALDPPALPRDELLQHHEFLDLTWFRAFL